VEKLICEIGRSRGDGVVMNLNK